MVEQRGRAAGVLAPAHRWTTVAVFALGFLIAFEALAVTTAMPLATRDLHGAPFYSLTFSAFTAAGVIGMVLAGAWSDRSGPTRPLLVATALFAVGLLIAGTAEQIGVLIIGRAVQGLGAGGIGVALYVLVARVYPEALHPRVFALLAAAWVLPSLIGPVAAGAVASSMSWHWVFLGIVPLVVAATALLLPTLRGRRMPGTHAPIPAGRVAWAVLAAAALLALQPLLELSTIGPALAVAAAVVAVAAIRPLLPRTTLRAGRGLPSVMVARALFSGGFACGDAYLPYALITLRHVPPALAGGILTVGAVSWAAGSALQSRFSATLTDSRCVFLGAVAFAIGLAGVAVVVLTGAPIPVLVAVWLATGLGVGLAYPRLATATLALSQTDERGRNSAALQIADGFGSGLALTLVGVLAAGAADRPFAAAFGLAAGIGVLVVLVAPRLATPLAR